MKETHEAEISVDGGLEQRGCFLSQSNNNGGPQCSPCCFKGPLGGYICCCCCCIRRCIIRACCCYCCCLSLDEAAASLESKYSETSRCCCCYCLAYLLSSRCKRRRQGGDIRGSTKC